MLLWSPARNTTLGSPTLEPISDTSSFAVHLAAHEPISFFREFDARILAKDHERVSYHYMEQYVNSVPLPFEPLDDSETPLTQADVASQLAAYIAAFEDPDSKMVCESIRSVVCGTASLSTWLTSTNAQGGGPKTNSRTYNRKLFSGADRMLWVTGVTCPRRAQVLEDWGMDEIALVFKDFRVNKNASVVTGIHIHAKQITGCYWQAVRPYSGSIRDFNDERKRLDDVKSGRCFGDLGKRFKHPYGMKN